VCTRSKTIGAGTLVPSENREMLGVGTSVPSSSIIKNGTKVPAPEKSKNGMGILTLDGNTTEGKIRYAA